MTEVDQQIERARATMARISEDYRGQMGAQYRAHGKRLKRKATSVGARLAFIFAVNAIILIAAGVAGMVIPLGLFGGLAVLLLMAAVTIAIAIAPAARAPSEKALREVDIKSLPAKTERWLEAQRPALPAPARGMVDRIGTRLETLSPQLGRLEGREEEAYEVRRLIGEQLPAFVNDYARVPEPLRRVERNGRTPDAELVAGLQLIEQEIADMTARLAQNDLDSLSTRGRFLEMKYRDETGDR
ncbi:hypothetical protein M9979_09060 [Sphingomonas sp. RP10(2022)]|uniref:Uncharacterized protein n=1 Tax=Sphingomonas liriopis TaxID=2949094 RepID=A0A9X2HPM2_9SPHN|nr:hypothetical protein [Sphingomonas liriopis]MCP3735016.1 hypothetical protein [Sphingomonas liriopis]